MSDDERDYQRYMAAMHAVQSAVALDIEVSGLNGAAADPKHLRTGINACLVDNRAIVEILIAKGLITHGEYLASLAKCAEDEQATMTTRLRERTGNPKLSFG